MAECEDKEEVTMSFLPLEESRDAAIRADFPYYTDGLMRSSPGQVIVTPRYAQVADQVVNFKVRPDDTWVVTFPKCGTTWVQEMVWLLANNLDYESAKKDLLDLRFPFLEVSRLSSSEMEEKYESNPENVPEDLFLTHEHIADLPSPRFIKSHMPFSLLPKELVDTCKVVYVARNPKDVAVSYFYHHKLISIHHFNGDFAQFVDYFINNELLYAPFVGHVLEAWNKRHHPHLLFLFYEDLKKDLPGEIRKVAEFLGKLISEEQVERLEKHLGFDSFVGNASVNCEHAKKDGFFSKDGRFIRKGVVGDWRNHFTDKLREKFDSWVKASLDGADLEFIENLSD